MTEAVDRTRAKTAIPSHPELRFARERMTEEPVVLGGICDAGESRFLTAEPFGMTVRNWGSSQFFRHQFIH